MIEDKNLVAYIYCAKEGTPLSLVGKVDPINSTALFTLVDSCFVNNGLDSLFSNSYDVGCKLVTHKEVSSLGLNFKLEFKYE